MFVGDKKTVLDTRSVESAIELKKMSLSTSGKVELKKDLDKRKYYEILEREKVNIEKTDASRNLIRLLQLQQREQEAATQQQKTNEQQAYRERSLQLEETLARELNELRREEICDIRERQRLRESSHELKELERQLRAAYTKRQLCAQMAENEERKLQEKLKIIENNKILEEARINEAEYIKNLKQMEINKKHEYRKELQDQIIFKEKMRKFHYEEFLKEKKLIDQIVARIHQEDERALQEKWLTMQKTKSEMESFRKAQEIWKKKQREQVELENKKIQEYMFSKQTDIQASVLEKQQKEKAREEMVDKIARRIYEEKTRQKEREDIQQELLEQERLEAAELREHSDLEKRFRQRLEMTRGLDQQVQEHIQLREEMAQQEAYYKNMIENNMKEGEKLEMMTAEKQRIKKIQLRKDLQELMAERRRKHAENMQIMQRLHEQEMEELAERNRKVEEERIRMLREHAEHLIGYMPKGLLREDDLPLLGKTVFDKYNSKKNTT